VKDLNTKLGIKNDDRKDPDVSISEEKAINAILVKAGIEDPEQTSRCIRSGLINGHFGEDWNLDALIPDTFCLHCENPKSPLDFSIRDLLEQTDYPGTDYEDGGGSAGVFCPRCKEGMYYSRACMIPIKKGRMDCGKFHNHCTRCPGLGVCIGGKE
jgi:hypothetical protein